MPPINAMRRRTRRLKFVHPRADRLADVPYIGDLSLRLARQSAARLIRTRAICRALLGLSNNSNVNLALPFDGRSYSREYYLFVRNQVPLCPRMACKQGGGVPMAGLQNEGCNPR